MPVNSKVFYKYLGHVPYTDGLRIQEELHNSLLNGNDGIDGCILMLSHEPVITFGKYSSEENLLVDEKILDKKGVKLYRSSRGGDITCHEPGQLVVYPVINLKNMRIGVKAYVQMLEETICIFLSQYGISGSTVTGRPGVWVGDSKIASIGINISRHVTTHGVAINIKNSLETFGYVNPCGYPEIGMTSVLKESGEYPEMEKAAKVFIKYFNEVFMVDTYEHPYCSENAVGRDWKISAA